MKLVIVMITSLLLGGAPYPAWAAGGLPEARQGHPEQAIPEVIHLEEDPPHALWVSAEAAFDSAGHLNTSLIHPHYLSTLQNHLSIPPEDGCIRLTEFFVDAPGNTDRTSPEKFVKNARFVLHAKVTDTAYGFKLSAPGQLLRLRPLAFLKGEKEAHDSYFVFFPVAAFQAGGRRICKTDSRFPAVPAVGDEIILSLPYRPDPGSAYLSADIWGPDSFITLGSGRVSLPGSFLRHGIEASDGESFLDQLRRYAEEGN
jgi:hypothetical protein